MIKSILELKFEEEIRDKMFLAKKECNYNPTRFHQMINNHGGVEITGNTSDGFTTLYLCDRLDLTMENSVCKEEYRSLFTADEIAYCEMVLGITES